MYEGNIHASHHSDEIFFPCVFISSIFNMKDDYNLKCIESMKFFYLNFKLLKRVKLDYNSYKHIAFYFNTNKKPSSNLNTRWQHHLMPVLIA